MMKLHLQINVIKLKSLLETRKHYKLDASTHFYKLACDIIITIFKKAIKVFFY